MAEVRKRAHETAGEVGELKAKVAKMANLQAVVPAIVKRVERSETKLKRVSEKQEISNLICCTIAIYESNTPLQNGPQV